MNKAREVKFLASEGSGSVSALFLRPSEARWLLVLGHGAGAGMRHPFMEEVSQQLAGAGVATFRYQFPYMELKLRRPDPQPLLLSTVRSAVEEAGRLDGALPLIAGGKSMGGRMTSLAASQEALPGVRGIVFFGFPLHAPGREGTERAEHLHSVTVPMLFLQGTRDRLADLSLLKPVCKKLPKATLHILEGGDHSFNMPKSSGRSQKDAITDLASAVSRWTKGLG